MISREEDILELYVIELQPKCWSICSTLSETKMIDTPRTLCFGSAEVYRNEAIAGRHCNNIINGGKFVNAKVVSLQFNQEPKLDSNVEEAIEYIHQSHHATHHNQVLTNEEFMDCKNTIKQHIYAHIGYKAIAHKLQSKLNAIEEVVENDILISMLNEEDIHYSDISTIQNILKGETK